MQENRYVSPVSIMEVEFFCSHLYDLSFFYHFHPFRVHFSDECFFIYPSSPLFPPVVLYQTPIITAEDPYVFPERSILEDQKKKKASVPGTSATETVPDRVQQAEDLALKNAAAFFGSALLKYLGISQSVSAVMPTEMVRLEVRHMYEDFNFQTADGAWLHFEFESDALSLADLKRFREYEATTARTFNVAVITYVICSSKVKRPISSLAEGINVYHVKLIRLKNKDSDRLFACVKEKQEQGMPLEKEDLVSLLLTPLMSGNMGIGERIIKSLNFIQYASKTVTPIELEKMKAVLYTLAFKFLNKKELAEVKEVIAMTELGKMLVNDGFEKGLAEGKAEVEAKFVAIIRKKRAKGLDASAIAEELELETAYVEKVMALIAEGPSVSDLQIAQMILGQ